MLRTLTMAALAALISVSAMAQEAKPAKKDSPPFIHPKEVELKTSVSPATAKPGDTVTFTVSANVDAPWHIYTYSKDEPEQGPRPTQFDFFDTAGLTVAGEWKASKQPTTKKEPAFPDLESVSFFEDEVSWSVQLKVPPSATAGEKSLKCQVSFQICNEVSCKPPVKITAPAATLTVAQGESRAVEPTGAFKDGRAAPRKFVPAPPPARAGGPPPVKTDVELTLERGIIPFLMLSVGAGLLALVMPCVWPMVPITVNFFVKQGQAGRSTKGLAITYCLSIIAIFTLVGLLFSAFFGASAVQDLATSVWLNLFVAVLFLAFGLSLLGLFELRLPSFLLNASAQGENRGGLVGVVFMALTLTITSFTCTFPVVGALLVMAARGNYLYPVVGLATFATVLALPFFVLALAPGILTRLPRSGDWMNAVKVVGGLLEIGAAFKFVNNVELALGTPAQDCWFNATTVLTLWVVIALVCGVYLLGLFRTDHDHDAVKVGPVRMIFGALFLFLALFLSPALFGRPPESRLWGRLVVGLLPPDIGSLKSKAAVVAGGGAAGAMNATSREPKVAETQQKTFHGVQWGMSYEDALARAKAEGKPILIDFTGEFCANCRQMEEFVLPRPEVVESLERFVTIQLFTDKVPIDSISREDNEEIAAANQLRQFQMARDTTLPLYVVVGPGEEVLASKGGFIEPSVFAEFLKSGLEKAKASRDKIARANVGAGR